MGIIPDKFILLDVRDDITFERVKTNLLSGDLQVSFKEEDIDNIVENAMQEYKL
jgi:hypothetical protein